MAKTLKNFVIEEMVDSLYDMEGREVYGADLGYSIFESANCDGSYTYNAHEAEEFIKEYYSDFGEVVEDIKFNLGAEFIPNPFLEAEKFQVVIMLEMSNALCANCKTIDENWNNELELTEETIKQIVNELMEQKD
jgi:hypothetical protein